MEQTYNLTQGKSSKLILNFFIPLLLTNLLQQIYNFADTAIVGKGLGDNALAAVGNMSSVTFLIIGFTVGMTNGFSVLIAKSFGADDYPTLRKTVVTSVKLAIAIAVSLTVISTLFLKQMLYIMQTPAKILSDSLAYGYIILGGLTATIGYNLFAAILRALGDSRTPFYSIIISTIINIILDCVFIFGMKTGVSGAAIATIIAQIISAVICFAKIRRIEIIRISHEDMINDISIYTNLLKNGLPMACMNSVTAVGCVVVQYFVNGLGVAYTSAYSACSKYLNMFMMPGLTAGLTMSSFTSQNYGAGKYERIQEGLFTCLGIAFIAYILLGSVMVFFPRTLAGFMITGDEPLALATEFLPICGVMLFAVDFLFVFRNGVQGMGHPFIPMCSGILEMFIRISVIVVFIPRLQFKATALAEICAWSGALLLNVCAFTIILHRNMAISREYSPAQTRSFSWLHIYLPHHGNHVRHH